MSIFASVIGPFGGFFGSGFKRAFKIKDFGDMIPGHGGVMDRFDCQFLMATFVNVYIHSFIRMASPQKLLQQVTDCLTNYKSLRNTLMPVYHCHKPVFRPKMPIFRRAGMREGGLPLPLAFHYLIFMI